MAESKPVRICQFIGSDSDHYWEIDEDDIRAAIEMNGTTDEKFDFVLEKARVAHVSGSHDVDYILVHDGDNDEEGWSDFVEAVQSSQT